MKSSDRAGRPFLRLSSFRDLGLVICDEEQDPSFKQYEPAPRYNGRDVAIYYASVFGADVLLGSATPSWKVISMPNPANTVGGTDATIR